MPYLFTFREILNLAKEFGRSLPGKHLIPRYFNIDRYARQKYGLISMCILSFEATLPDSDPDHSQNLIISSFYHFFLLSFLTYPKNIIKIHLKLDLRIGEPMQICIHRKDNSPNPVNHRLTLK